MSSKRLLWMALLLALVPGLAAAQATGQLSGVVTGPGDVPLSGVTVVIDEAGMAEITDGDGRYTLVGLPAGTYTVTLSLGERVATVENVTVTAGQTTALDHQVDWEVSFAETITVFSASRRRERVVEAPAAVTVVSEEQLEREAPHGQLAKVLEFTPGAQVTQSGLYDFNLNTRGFNSSLNRRVPALVDGRDPTVPFLMSNDWPAMSSMADMASVELVRGPSSALYGTNAFNGVLVLTTKQPRYSQGGAVQITGGELSTLRGDVRWSGGLTEDSYLKVHGSYTQSDDFYRARNVAFDDREEEFYRFCASAADTNCIRREAAPLQREDDDLWLAGVRFDHYLGNSFFTVEGGISDIQGPVIQTGIGRVQVTESDRPWARFNFSHPRFNVLAYHNQRDAPVQRALSSGANLVLDEENWAVELQGNMDFHEQKGRIIGGISYRDEEIDTRNDAGVSTLTRFNPVGTEREAAYAQAEYAFTPKIKGVLAGRYDDSELHDAQFSPKVAFVLAPTPNQTVRLTYNQAFQSPNYSEFFLRAPAGAPITGFANTALGALDPTLRNIPILAIGNPALEVEEIASWEIGYSGILGGRTFLTIDYYNSELENFVTDLLPGVNPEFPRYAPPANLPPQVQAVILGTLAAALGPNAAGLTRLSPTVTGLVLSYANAGAADTQGVDLGVNFYLTDAWTLGVNYSWFDFELQESLDLDRVLPNSPENSGSISLGYVGERFDGSVAYRYVEEFDWAAGVFVGTVPQYDIVDVTFGMDVTDNFRLGINVANAIDDEHIQAFGGDVIGRRALGSLTFSW